MNQPCVNHQTPVIQLTWKRILMVIFCFGLMSQTLRADVWYVNNKTGHDSHNGQSTSTAVATLQQAVRLCQAHDTINIAKTGIAYRESLILKKKGGSAAKPLLIEGNNAVLSGLSLLVKNKWKHVAGDVYFYPYGVAPYGNPVLVQHHQRIKQAVNREQLQPEQHYWNRKTGIYFRCATGKKISDYTLEATTRTSGLMLQSSSYVVCQNLCCEFFSNDGFNIHGDCRGIRLEHVIARYNGDDGISIHEVGGMVVQHAHVHHNFFGLQDVNASRSYYNGLLIEENEVGVSMVGGYHSLVDSIVRNNLRSQIDIAGATPQHLPGSKFNPLCKTLFFAKNVLVFGGGSAIALIVRNDSHAIMESCVLSNSKVGLTVSRLGGCHLTRSLIEKCEVDIVSQSEKLFSDFNIFTGGIIQWRGEIFKPKQWDSFCKKAKHNKHSRIGIAVVTTKGEVKIPPESTAHGIKGPVGPNSPVIFDQLKFD